MPALSKKQRELMAIAEHHPEQLHAANRGLLMMNLSDLAKLAGTRERGLLVRAKKRKKARR